MNNIDYDICRRFMIIRFQSDGGDRVDSETVVQRLSEETGESEKTLCQILDRNGIFDCDSDLYFQLREEIAPFNEAVPPRRSWWQRTFGE